MMALLPSAWWNWVKLLHRAHPCSAVFRSMNYGLKQKFRSVISLMWQMSLNLPCALRKVSS
ncbi:Uncharacterised protein [Vibrio cholerae]|uniref:Uncharacterized protein n=1 Tax=Vibrio cholerae TaxID=666 RepID=A0A655QL99_VIBCL|nr:Uncharacterised protein [Vibrio cholerae]